MWGDMPPAVRARFRGSRHKLIFHASALKTSRWRLLTPQREAETFAVEIGLHVELKWRSYDGVYLTGFSVIY